INGAPTRVEPKSAMDHKDITRPRMCDADSNWIIVFAIEERQMEKKPTNPIATVARPSVGIAAVTHIETPKRNAHRTNSCTPTAFRLAEKSPPTTLPAPIAESKAA